MTTKINVLIIEDNPDECSELSNVLVANNYNIVGAATNYKDALEKFYTLPVDIVIIDVFLDGRADGITFAETISIVPGASKPFVFLTSSKDRNIFERAKLTRPYSFLMKPFNELEVLYAIEMAVEKFYEQHRALAETNQNAVIGDEHLFIKKKNALKKVLISDILYVEVEERYCNIYTESEKFVVLISLVKIAALFENYNFVRTHRNYLVNAKKITAVILNENTILLNGDLSIPLSDKYKSLLKNMTILS